MSNCGYNRLLDLVAENPGYLAEELVEMSTDEGFGADEVEGWLDDALDVRDVMEFDSKHWLVRKGRFAYDKYNHQPSQPEHTIY